MQNPWVSKYVPLLPHPDAHVNIMTNLEIFPKIVCKWDIIKVCKTDQSNSCTWEIIVLNSSVWSFNNISFNSRKTVLVELIENGWICQEIQPKKSPLVLPVKNDIYCIYRDLQKMATCMRNVCMEIDVIINILYTKWTAGQACILWLTKHE